MKQRSMSIKMSRTAFVELYKYMESLPNQIKCPPIEPPPSMCITDFVERNKEKFEKVKTKVDEPIQFPVYSIVEFKPSENGTRLDRNAYYVIRARKTPSGKREYWLWNISNPRPMANRRITPDRKVGATALVASSHFGNPNSYFSGCKLPKPI